MNDRARRVLRALAIFVSYAVVAALIALPVAVERAVEHARFEDRLGTFPVEVTLAHNGVSTVDTGLMGKLYWSRTGAGGFGATVTASGPPEAGGTLSSYVTPAFLRANAAFVDNPDAVARAYGAELRSQVIEAVVLYDLLAGLAGGLLLLALFRAQPPPLPAALRHRRYRRILGYVAYGMVGLGASSAAALLLFSRWHGTAPVDTSYPMPGVDGLSFSSAQTRELAQQIQPFIEKNRERAATRAAAYREVSLASLQQVLPRHAEALAPRDGEVIVIAEADPQGSHVATDVRTSLYPLLQEHLGADNLVLRTISGDVSSNGTVAEERFVRAEAAASSGIPTVVVKGDHDSATTVEQLQDDALVIDREVTDAGGLLLAGAADPAFKSLFGGLVTNESGISEEERGQQLRDVVDPDAPVIVLVHQPATAAGYLGIEHVEELPPALEARAPRDDGIPDVPPGALNIGHRHDPDGPWIVWNTDSEMVTWTVVTQLGTSGGVEETPTFNRFSTPFSTPLKSISIQLQYVNAESGLQTGYASIVITTQGQVEISDRVPLGLPGGMPVPREDFEHLQ